MSGVMATVISCLRFASSLAVKAGGMDIARISVLTPFGHSSRGGLHKSTYGPSRSTELQPGTNSTGGRSTHSSKKDRCIHIGTVGDNTPVHRRVPIAILILVVVA